MRLSHPLYLTRWCAFFLECELILLLHNLLVTCDIFLLPDVWKLWRKNSRKISVGDMVLGLWNICQMNKCYLFYSAICSGWLKEFED